MALKPARQAISTLILSGNIREAKEFADMMGFLSHEWTYVERPAHMLMQHRGKTVYVVGTARDREDFGAIEGLFIQGDHDVMDMNE